jgi:hypothetical protein
MDRNLQHPDAYHAYLYPEKVPPPKPSQRDLELEAWLERALHARQPDPDPIIRDL